MTAWVLRHRFRVFLAAVICLKLLLAGLFSSDYETKMFMPFVRDFLAQPGANPYEAFRAIHTEEAFPYPPLMLLIESVGGLLASLFPSSWFMAHLLFKLPLLFFDCLGLWFLMKMFPHRRKYLGVLYFASPMILYAAYMHGQLDVIPTSLFLGALFYMLHRGRGHDARFALLLVLALLTKLHILAALPLLVIVLWKRGDYRKIAWAGAMLLIVGGLAVWPFAGEVFWQTVLFNKEQSLLTQVYLGFVDLKLYLPILALAVIYLQVYMLRAMNNDLFLSFVGILFSVFLALVPPGAGWYLWIVPYIAIFFINVPDNKYKHLALYVLLNFFYLLYFLTAHHTRWTDLYFLGGALSWLKVSSAVYRNLSFTLLTGSLLCIIYAMYHYGVASNLFYQRMGSPFAIGIAGDSGTGKSTLLAVMARCFGKKKILLMEGDGDHKWERGAAMWEVFTHLNPKANFLYRQAHDIALLKKGTSVQRVDYDHTTGTFTKAHKISPKPYILLSGLHAFYLPQMRNVLDLKIYMDTDETLRRYWKIRRDTKQRGYDSEKTTRQIEERMPDTERYIAPQKEYADLVISYFDDTLHDPTDTEHVVVMGLKFTLPSAIDAEPLVHAVTDYGIKLRYEFSRDLKHQVLVFEGASLDGPALPFHRIMPRVIPHMEELTEEDLRRLDNREGILQLMLLLVISHKMHLDMGGYA